MTTWKVCYKFRIRESDQLKTVLELYDMENRQKISMPDYQKLKTMVKRSTDQKLRLRNFDARNERIETGAVVTNRNVSAPNHFVIIGILPNVNSVNPNSVVNSVISARLHTGRWKWQY